VRTRNSPNVESRFDKSGGGERPWRHRSSAQSINPVIRAGSPVGQGCRMSTEAARWERTSGPDRTFAEYTPRVHSTCRTLADIGHRHLMQLQTNQTLQRCSQQVPGFYSYIALCFHCSLVESHVSARDLFVVSRLLDTGDKGSRRRVFPATLCQSARHGPAGVYRVFEAGEDGWPILRRKAQGRQSQLD